MHVVARHAVIQSITLQSTQGTTSTKIKKGLNELATSLIGKRYATLEGVESSADSANIQDEVLIWLRSTM